MKNQFWFALLATITLTLSPGVSAFPSLGYSHFQALARRAKDSSFGESILVANWVWLIIVQCLERQPLRAERAFIYLCVTTLSFLLLAAKSRYGNAA